MPRFNPATQEKSLLCLLICMVMLGPFSVDAYLPLMPQIADDLKAPDAVIQFTVGGFLIGTALGPLFAGPLSDAVGRRLVVLVGVLVFAICAVGGATVQSGEALVTWRIVQSVAGASAFVAGLALMSDLYDPETLAKRTSLVMVFVSVAPMIAPIFGAWLASVSDWRSIFWVLSVAGALIYAVALFRLPETLPAAAREPVRPANLARGYLSTLSNTNAVFYVMASVGMSGAFFAFLAGSPFLYIDFFGLNPQQYAWVFAAGAALAILGNIINIQMVARIGFRGALVAQGLLAMVLGALLIAGCFGLTGRWAIFAAGLLIMPVQHVITANSNAGVMAQFDARRGLANSVALSARYSSGAFAVWLVGVYGHGPERFGLILFTFLALGGIFAQLAVRRERTQ